MNSLLLLGDKSHELKDRITLLSKNGLDEINIETCESDSCEDFLSRIFLPENLSDFTTKTKTTTTPVIINAAPYCQNRLRVISKVMKGRLSCIMVFDEFYGEHVGANFYVHDRKLYLKKEYLLNESYINKLLKCLYKQENIVYISYGNDASGEARRLISHIDEISSIAVPFMNFRYDFKTLARGDSIADFMEEIQSSNAVLLIINDRYLYSEDSMKEFSGLLANSESLKDKVFPLVLDSAEEIIHDAIKINALYTHWLEKKKDIEKTIQLYGDSSGALATKLNLYDDITEAVLSMSDFLNNLYYLPLGLYKNERFSPLFWEIDQLLLKSKSNGYISVFRTEKDMLSALAREADQLI